MRLSGMNVLAGSSAPAEIAALRNALTETVDVATFGGLKGTTWYAHKREVIERARAVLAGSSAPEATPDEEHSAWEEVDGQGSD
jgi:hypothetical protein